MTADQTVIELPDTGRHHLPPVGTSTGHRFVSRWTFDEWNRRYHRLNSRMFHIAAHRLSTWRDDQVTYLLGSFVKWSKHGGLEQLQ